MGHEKSISTTIGINWTDEILFFSSPNLSIIIKIIAKYNQLVKGEKVEIVSLSLSKTEGHTSTELVLSTSKGSV